MYFCSICKKDIEEEMPAVLTMGRSMTPRHLCSECEALLDTATSSRESDKIKEAMGRISETLMSSACEDGAVIATVNDLLESASERLRAIEEGSYDFSLDEQSEDEFEITADMMETEEDRELDRIDEEREKRFDKVLNWAWLGIGVGIVAYFVWFFFFR